MPRKYESQIISFGLIVSKLRAKAKLTQKQLAERCEVDVRTIRRVEKGEIAIGLETILSLADVFEIQPHQLLKHIN